MRHLPTIAIMAALASLSPRTGMADSIADFYGRTALRMVIAADPGGSYDSDARLVARHLGRHLAGNPKVIPENMIGASGRLAANYIYRTALQDGSVIAALQQTIPSVVGASVCNGQAEAALTSMPHGSADINGGAGVWNVNYF